MLVICEHHKSMENIGQLVPSGFQLTFANGNTISVQFGMGNYCNNRYDSIKSCENAEIAIWDKDNKWYEFPDSMDTVKGYCSSDEVAKWIWFAANNVF